MVKIKSKSYGRTLDDKAQTLKFGEKIDKRHFITQKVK